MKTIKSFQKFILEKSTFDKIKDLDKWKEEQQKEIDKIKNLKVWKYKSDRLLKNYFKQKRELTKDKNSYAMAGNSKVNYIYHYTNLDGLQGILQDDMMYGDEGISFTSNANLYKRGFVFWHPSKYTDGKHSDNVGIKIKLDFRLMKKDGYKFIKGDDSIGTHPGEEEIRLKSHELKNASKYFVEVIVFKDKEQKYKEASELLTKNNIIHKII